MSSELSAGPYRGNSTCQPARTWSPAPGVVIYDTTKPAVTVTLVSTFSFTPPQCGQCCEQATCAYSYGAGSLYACGSHDPTRQPGWLTGPAPMFFEYRTLDPLFAVTHTTGQPGIAQPQR